MEAGKNKYFISLILLVVFSTIFFAKLTNAAITPLSVYCFGSPNIAYRGQQVTWSAVASGGNGKYKYSWSGSNDLSGNTVYVPKKYSVSGEKNAIVTVTSGNYSAAVQCNVMILPGFPPLTASCSTPSPATLVGQKVNWSAKVSGGVGNYTYEWGGDVVGNYSVASKTYNDVGTKTATLKVFSGSDSETAECSTEVLENWPPLTASCFANPSSALINQQVVWSAKAIGGNGKYTYNWTGNDSFSGSSLSISGYYTTPGTKTATVTVRDSVGNSDTVRCPDLVIGWPKLSVFCSTTPSAGFVGQQVSWIASASGGQRSFTGGVSSSSSTPSSSSSSNSSSSSSSSLGSSTCSSNFDCPLLQECYNKSCVASPATKIVYSYQWTGDISSNSYMASTTYRTPGKKTAIVKARSSSGQIAENTCSIDITMAPLSLYCFPSASLTTPNANVIWNAVASGGDGVYTYSWSGTDGIYGSQTSVSKRYSTVGLKTATITVEDSSGHSKVIQCGSGVSINWPVLLASCSASPSSTSVNKQVLWSAKATGGTGTYYYKWNGDVDSSSANDLSYYSTSGRKTANVTVTSGGISVTSANCYSNISQ